jgi:phosphatidate cytidylyltransferase
MAGAEAKKSDLPARVGSALVMVAVAGTALWLSGWVWAAFVALVALGVLWEWSKLAFAITPKSWARALWLVGGVGYVGVAAILLATMNNGEASGMVDLLLVAVIATDIGAYFAGRTFGGPKIAPAISPSKTWSGLIGGALAAGVGIAAFEMLVECGGAIDYDCLKRWWAEMWLSFPAGALIAVAAQAGDFFESWMKRRAGVKDSGKLLPGHGGLFDRVDGLLAVSFALGTVLSGVAISHGKGLFILGQLITR